MLKNLRFLISFVFFLSLSISSVQAQFVNFEETWQEFLAEDKTSNISQLVKPAADQKENYIKYCLMYANAHFCAGEIDDAEKLMGEVRKIGAPTQEKIQGFKPKFDDLTEKIKAYHKVADKWHQFDASNQVQMSDLEIDLATKVCEKGTLAKYFQMVTSAHYCNADLDKARGAFENRVLKLAEKTSLKISDVKGLEPRVATTKKLFIGLKKLDVAWKEWMDTDVSPGFDYELPVVECYSIPNMQVYLLRAATDVCKNGSAMLAKIKKLQITNTHTIPADVKEKIAWLEKAAGTFTGDADRLNKAWGEFVETGTIKTSFSGKFCKKEDQIRALIIDGSLSACTKGAKRLKNIAKIREEHDPKLQNITLQKIKELEEKVAKLEGDIAALNELWKEFIDNNDTIPHAFTVEKFYCDHIAQVKSWVLVGNLDACGEGQQYLDKIAALKKKHKLQFDKELACRVHRLKDKVWYCRYIELVIQARKETHAERERFGPKSSKVMEMDLNSAQLPCRTTVRYQPLGNIGVKYTINTYMCQDIDLAKMGDPEYYRKIARWVDNEVLSKYCEANMRCKEKFNIYLEGHTDGHPFRGARYKNSLGIPAGTYYTHFLNGQALQKTTSREITNSLKNNMELGIARAWTVKQQLDFMGVPISIGAWEHPVTEKGGEYRKVQIDLNITNLLLDFYEKLLAKLVKDSGIGERPGPCK